MEKVKKSKSHSFLKKTGASLKRNFYTLPFAFICIACFFFLGTLFILIKSVGRIEYKPASIFLFIATLASILTIVAVISYTKKVYGQKRPLKMLIIYYVLVVVCLGFTIAVFYFNEKQIAIEIANRDATTPEYAEWYVYQTYINYGICSRTLLIIFFVLEGIANILLMTAPLFEKKLKTINFDLTFSNDKKQK